MDRQDVPFRDGGCTLVTGTGWGFGEMLGG